MQKTHGLSHCRFCGKKLSALRMLFSSESEFCGKLHRFEYAQKQNELGLARLLEGDSRTAAENRWEQCARKIQSTENSELVSSVANS